MITLKDLHLFTGHPAQFWPAFLTFTRQQLNAARAFLLTRQADNWKQLLTSPAEKHTTDNPLLPEILVQLADSCWTENQAVLNTKAGEAFFIAQKLEQQEEQAPKVLIVQMPDALRSQIDSQRQQMGLLADVPLIYQRERMRHSEQQQRADFAQILELLLLLNEQDNFVAASMTLVNETVSRYHCSRVSLGWQNAGYVRLQCISHMDQFEPKMEIVNQLEAAMEEAFDQDEEILSPASETEGPVDRDHLGYTRNQQLSQLLSLPLRVGNQPVGVLTCEREHSMFTEADIRSLRILRDQIATRLDALKKSDRWIGARLLDSLRAAGSKLFGVEQTLLKLSGVVICGLLLASAVVQLPYRVEAPFILRSKDVRQVTAPFAGYIDEVQAEIGQQVMVDSPLLSLDNSDLLLDEAAALANQVRYLKETEKARAQHNLIEMKIAQAQADQAQAKLELIQHQLNLAQLRSPIEGIVVEGDFSEKRGAPVEKGELLFRVAQGKNLFAEIKVAERDIQEISTEQRGELAFVSRPQLRFPLRIKQIDPLASAEDAGNVFVLRTEVFSPAADWWRPGMSGIAKIRVAKRSVLWIISHRTINFLRLLIWW